MQHSALVLSLEKEALQSLRSSLLSRLTKLNTTDQGSDNNKNLEHELNTVKFEDFALSILDHFNSSQNDLSYLRNFTQSNSFQTQMASIVAVFDAVDVDSKGFIAFSDFVDFCLRLGRLLLKPDVKNSISTYLQYQGQKSSLFPTYKMRYNDYLRLLFVFDSDSPRVRVFRKDGKYIDKINPITDAHKYLRFLSTPKLTFYEKTISEKEVINIRNVQRDLDETKGHIMDMEHLDSVKQVVISTSHHYLLFLDVNQGLKDKNDNLRVIGYLKTKYVMHKLYYSKILNYFVTIPGEGSDHSMEIYEPATKQLKFRISKHDSKILSIVEVILDKAHPRKNHYFVTSSIDKKVIMWPSATMSAYVQNTQTKRMLRVGELIDYDLVGHNHAIQSLAYAFQQEVLFGCGFDYEIIAWDPLSRDMIMKLVGHFKSLLSIQIVYLPDEKLLSLDESGVLKMWNINKDLGLYGDQESSLTLQCAQPPTIKDFAVTFDKGKGIAILAEKVYFLQIENDLVDDLKPIESGLVVCPMTGRILSIYNSTIQIFDISSCKKLKRIAVLDPDRISSHDELVSKTEQIRMDASIRHMKLGHKATTNGSNSTQVDSGASINHFIDFKDKVTAVASDSKGKKVFIGTHDGRVLLFDSFTCGLLKQLTNVDEDCTFQEQGKVVKLYYVDRDELVVSLHANGSVKVFGGNHRAAGAAETANQPSGTASSSSFMAHLGSGKKGRKQSLFHGVSKKETILFHENRGGKAPHRPFMLRECDLGATNDYTIIVDMAVSVEHNAIAVLNKFGYVYVYDYLTLDFLSCISLTPSNNSKDSSTMDHHEHNSSSEIQSHYLSVRFVPLLPILCVVDNQHQMSAWSIKTMTYKHLYTWNIYEDISYNKVKEMDCYSNLSWKGMENLVVSQHSSSLIPVINRFSVACHVKIYYFYNTNHHQNLGSGISYNATISTATNSPHQWILIIGNEQGQILTSNITQLIINSGGIEALPKLDTPFAVYQKAKPRRFFSHEYEYATTYHRTKLPEEWSEKLKNPHKQSNTDNNHAASRTSQQQLSSVDISAAVNITSSTFTVMINEDESSSHLHSNVSFSVPAMKTDNSSSGKIPPKLTKQATRKWKSTMKKSFFRLDGDSPLFSLPNIEGLYAWNTCNPSNDDEFSTNNSHNTQNNSYAIKSITFYNPWISYLSEALETNQRCPFHYNLYDNEMNVSSNQVLPLMTIVNDQGHIQMWNFRGDFMGSNGIDQKEGLSEQPFKTDLGKKSKKEKEKEKLQKAETNSILAEALQSSTATFITSIMAEPEPYESILKGSMTDKQPAVEDPSLMPKVYLRSEKSSKITTRRMSVVMKSNVKTLDVQSSTEPGQAVYKKALAKAIAKKDWLHDHQQRLLQQYFHQHQHQFPSKDLIFHNFFLHEFKIISRHDGQPVTMKDEGRDESAVGWLCPVVNIFMPLSYQSSQPNYASSSSHQIVANHNIKDEDILHILYSMTYLTYSAYTFYAQQICAFISEYEQDVIQLMLQRMTTKLANSPTQRSKTKKENLFSGKPSLLKAFEETVGETLQQQSNSRVESNATNKSAELNESFAESTAFGTNKLFTTKEDNLFNYIISDLKPSEMLVAQALQDQVQKKIEKKNAVSLISYLQENEYFQDHQMTGFQALSSKKGMSHLKNYEKEVARKQPSKLDFSRELPQEYLDQIETLKEEFRQRKLAKRKKIGKAYPEILENSALDIHLLSNINDHDVFVPLNEMNQELCLRTISMDQSFMEEKSYIIKSSLLVATNALSVPHDGLQPALSPQFHLSTIDHGSFLQTQTSASVPINLIDKTFEEGVQSTKSRPRTAPSSRSKSNAILAKVSASPKALSRRPNSASSIHRARSSNDINNEKDRTTEQDTAVSEKKLSRPSSATYQANVPQLIQSELKMNAILSSLDDISLTDVSLSQLPILPATLNSNKDCYYMSQLQYPEKMQEKLQSMQQVAAESIKIEITSKIPGRSGSPTTQSPKNANSSALRLGILPTSFEQDAAIVSTEQQYHTQRLTEISKYYDDAILSSKLYSQSFHLYDPLHDKNSNDNYKQQKKLKRKIYLSQFRDCYIDASADVLEVSNDHSGAQQDPSDRSSMNIQQLVYQDIVDMEKEYKKLEKKKYLQQLSNMEVSANDSKSYYGSYRVMDLFQFYHFKLVLHPLDSLTMDRLLKKQQSNSSHRPKKLYYFDEFGNDFSKLLQHNQKYFAIDEVIDILMELLHGESALEEIEEQNTEKDDKRNEMPNPADNVVENNDGEGNDEEIETPRLPDEPLRTIEVGDSHSPKHSGGDPFIASSKPIGLTQATYYSQHKLIQDCVYYREVSPHLPYISMFHLIEIFFSQSAVAELQNSSSGAQSGVKANDSHQNLHLHLRIFMFVSTLEMFYELIQSAIPPKMFGLDEAGSDDGEPLDNTPKSPIILSATNTASMKSLPPNNDNSKNKLKKSLSVSFLEDNTRPKSAPLSRTSNVNYNTKSSPSKFKRQLSSTIETDKLINTPSTPNDQAICRPSSPSLLPTETQSHCIPVDQTNPISPVEYSLRNQLLLAPLVGQYIVKPHPTRGFRQWILRKRAFSKLSKILDIWYEGNMTCLSIQDFIDIFQSIVPRAERDRYRIIQGVIVNINRIALKPTAELSGEILLRLLENALEMKIISS